MLHTSGVFTRTFAGFSINCFVRKKLLPNYTVISSICEWNYPLLVRTCAVTILNCSKITLLATGRNTFSWKLTCLKKLILSQAQGDGIWLGILGLEIRYRWSEERDLDNMKGKEKQPKLRWLSLGRCAFLETVMHVLSTVPSRISHEFKIWEGNWLLADLSVSANLLSQKKRLVYVFFLNKIRLRLWTASERARLIHGSHSRFCRSRFDGCEWFMKCSVLDGLAYLIHSLGYG